MAWSAFDDDLYFHPKVLAAGREARELWMASIVWSNHALTDGFIPYSALPLIAAMAGLRQDRASLDELVDTLLRVRLFEPEPQCAEQATGTPGEGLWIHDYLDYQLSAAEVAARRAAAAGKRGREGSEEEPPSAEAPRTQGKARSRAKTGALSRSEAGRRGAQKRWARRRALADADDSAIADATPDMANATADEIANATPDMANAMARIAKATPIVPPQSPPIPISIPKPSPNPSPGPRGQQQQQDQPLPAKGRPEGGAIPGRPKEPVEAEDDWAQAQLVASLAGVLGESVLARDEARALWERCGRDAGFWDAAVRQCATHGARTLAYLGRVIEDNLAAGTRPGQRAKGRAGRGATTPADVAFEAAYTEVREAAIGTGSEAERGYLRALWERCAGDDQFEFWSAAVQDADVHGGRSFSYLEKVIEANLAAGTWPGWRNVPREGAAAQWDPAGECQTKLERRKEHA